MSTTRSIAAVHAPPGIHWVGDGFRVHGYFTPQRDLVNELSPFLLLDYHPPYAYPPLAEGRRGVGVHPHRGFETVTLAFEGSVEHRDSAGGGGTIGPGDVQWMTAASGVLHREYHEPEFARRGGTFHMAQLWVNLPRVHKMDPPRYQGISAAEIGSFSFPGHAGVARIIAGELGGVVGPAATFTPVRLFDLRLRAGGRVAIRVPSRENVGLLVMSGSVTSAGELLRTAELAVVAHDGDVVELEAREDSQVLLFGGEPIDEPVVQYGPFVMTSRQEIMKAVTDFQAGAFGTLT